MALVRWQPSNPFSFSRDVDRLFGSVWGSGGGTEVAQTAAWRPSVDITESEDEFVLSADLPGIDREDLDVTVEDGRLTLKGQRRQEGEEGESKEGNTHRTERAYGTFTRAFDLPAAVDAESISAAYKDGVLTIAVPKAEEAKPKQIEVKIAS